MLTDNFKLVLPSVWMDNVCQHTNNKHNNHLSLDEALHHNWRIYRKLLKYQGALSLHEQIHIPGR
jgi:hypothetical protein